MASVIPVVLILFGIVILGGLDVWSVISLVLFIIAAARKSPDKGRKLGVFIASVVIRFIIKMVYSLFLFAVYFRILL